MLQALNIQRANNAITPTVTALRGAFGFFFIRCFVFPQITFQHRPASPRCNMSLADVASGGLGVRAEEKVCNFKHACKREAGDQHRVCDVTSCLKSPGVSLHT